MKSQLLAASLLLAGFGATAQSNIFELMDRTDLTLQQAEAWADNYFKTVGTGQGTGYKQYQRWLYERKFHTDAGGHYITPEQEDQAYYDAVSKMRNKSRAGYVWKEMGPAGWNATSSWNPGVGRVTSVAVNPQDTNIIYVSSPGGGIWKSTDGGKSWTSLIDFVNSGWLNVFHMCIDPLNPNTVYASLTSGGVLKSTNGGTSWSTTGSGPSTTRQVRVHPNNSSIVYAAAGNGIWRSVNGGVKWTQVQNETKEDIEFNPANPTIMYASGSGGKYYVWRSVDSGKTWKGIDSAAGIFKMGRTMLAVSKNNPARVYAAQASGSVFGRMYRSDDTGKTYTVTIVGNASKGKNFFGYTPDGKGTTGQAGYDMAICANPDNADEVHIAGIICWKSTDGADSFIAETVWSYPNGTGYNHADVHALEWVGKTIYSGSDGGIYKSTDHGDNWTDLSSGLGIRQFYRITCAPTDRHVIVGGAQDNGSTFRRNDGKWYEWLGADGMDNLISPTDARIAIGTSQNGGIYRTTNSGASRMDLSKPSNGNWVTPLAMHPSNHDTIYGGWTGIYRSDNMGLNWTRIAKSINATMDVLAVAPSNPRFIYAAKGSTLYRIINGGDTWSSRTFPASITSVYVSKYNPHKIWVTCNSSSKRVLYSENDGDTLKDISAGLPALSARSVVVDEDAHQTIYVGMNIGVYYRDTITKAWNQHATGLPLVAVNEVEIQKSGAKLRVATYGRGVWESDLRNVQLPCDAPTSLKEKNVTQTGAILQWTASFDATEYEVAYKKASDTGWTIHKANTTATADTLSGLAHSTLYDWRVKSICSGSGSNYAADTFVTVKQSTVGIQQMLPAEKIRLWPDPASDLLNGKLLLIHDGDVEIRITDMTGKVLAGSKLNGKAGINNFSFDVSTLSPGNYSISLTGPFETANSVFVISR